MMRAARSTTRTTGRPDGPAAGPSVSRPSDDRSLSRADSPSRPIVLRLRVFLSRRRLDRQIAAGHARADVRALELRARQLTHPRSQQMVASSLRQVVGHVDRLGAGPDLSAVVIDRATVRASREAILGLADRLGQASQVSSWGMVLARELVTDGATSPLYRADGGRALMQSLWEISDALGSERPATGTDAGSYYG